MLKNIEILHYITHPFEFSQMIQNKKNLQFSDYLLAGVLSCLPSGGGMLLSFIKMS